MKQNPWEIVDQQRGHENVRITATVKMQGKLLQFKTGPNHYRQPIPVKRGVIQGFSHASRLRLLKFVATVDWGRIGKSSFITLTYPDLCGDPTIDCRRKHKYLWIRYMEKHLGHELRGLWRIEWKTRRSGKCKGEIKPHWHFLCFDEPYVDQWLVRDFWRKILHVKGALATDVTPLDNAEMAGVYVAKYVAKECAPNTLDYAAYRNNPGRAWGYLGKELIEMLDVEWIREPSPEQIAWLLWYANDVLDWVNKEHKSSFTLLGHWAIQAIKKLREWGLTNSELPGDNTPIKGGTGLEGLASSDVPTSSRPSL